MSGQLTNADISRLAGVIGSNWESVMLILGFKKAQVELELENAGHNVKRAIPNLLIKWRQRVGKEATFENLRKVFKEAEELHSVSVDWDVFDVALTKHS